MLDRYKLFVYRQVTMTDVVVEGDVVPHFFVEFCFYPTSFSSSSKRKRNYKLTILFYKGLIGNTKKADDLNFVWMFWFLI